MGESSEGPLPPRGKQRRQCGGHAVGVASDLAPGETDDREARERETLVAKAVVLEGLAARVEGTAVGLDDEALGPPEEVGL
jgi:hypothetical protein